MKTVIRDLTLNKEMDSNDMAATEGGRMNPITLTHNLTNYNTPPLLGIGAPSLGGELLDDTEPNLNPAGV